MVQKFPGKVSRMFAGIVSGIKINWNGNYGAD